MKSRDEEILFYLPLVIEQIAIGVSSSLDIGPCIQRIVQMADERDTHNPVTELIRFAQFHVKTGVGLEEALVEVGRLSGHIELKHSFLALSQVAKFGGEITKQLQELADAVASQRETKIEAKIKQLELVATAPVGVVFLAFMVTLVTGFGLQVLVALSGQAG
jgi:pilus assembly protein TadC